MSWFVGIQLRIYSFLKYLWYFVGVKGVCYKALQTHHVYSTSKKLFPPGFKVEYTSHVGMVIGIVLEVSH